MAKFLTTRGTISAIEDIINSAEKGLVLISPYIKIPASLFQNIIAADKKGVKITLIYGKGELQPEVNNQLNRLNNLKRHYLENVHSKCYFNEQSMVITSLNLHSFSEQNNREMGVLLTLASDEAAFKDAVNEANLMLSITSPMANHQPDFSKSLVPSPSIKSASLLQGFTDIVRDSIGIGRGYCIR